MKRLILGNFIFLLCLTAVYSQNQAYNRAGTYVMVRDSVNASTWIDLMNDPRSNFYDIQSAFYGYWDGKNPEKGKGYKVFRRWEAFMEPRVYPSGQRKMKEEEVLQEFSNFKASFDNGVQTKSSSGSWTSLGPNSTPVGVWSGQPGGNGRINCIDFNPKQSSKMYVGAPSGGLWRSNNSGSTWFPVNDTFAVLGISDVAINHVDTSIIYLATGDGDAGDTYSVGVLKSTNSGQTWHSTALNLSVSQGIVIRKLLMHPTNPDIMWAATNAGVLKTTDGWTTWVNATGEGATYDIELKPDDPNIVYAGGNAFWRSTDGGLTFSAVTLPTTPAGGIQRIAIAVTPAAVNNVYLLLGRADNQGFGGYYRSTNAGTSFTEVYDETTANHNLLGWAYNYSDAGGQAFYDLVITVNPTNANELYIGGVNLSKSTNGGTTWAICAAWENNQGYPYAHADHHALEWLPGSSTTLFSGNDGGVFRTTNNGTAWTDISGNLAIAQLWGMGISTTNPALIMTGWQDNGVNKLLSGSWTHERGGDGCEAMCSYSSNTRVFGSYPDGYIFYSTVGGTTWSSIAPTGQGGNGEWVTPMIMQPSNQNTIYSGYTNVYRNINATPTAANWSQRGTVGGTGNIFRMALAPSDSINTMYVIKQSGVYKTINLNAGTPTWTNVTSNLPVSSALLTDITVDRTDANRVYVTFSGYVDGLKVYMTTNGGTSWTNISGTLPNLPFNAV